MPGQAVQQFGPAQVRDRKIFRQSGFGDALIAHAHRLFLDLHRQSLEQIQVIHKRQGLTGQVIQQAGNRRMDNRNIKLVHFLAGRQDALGPAGQQFARGCHQHLIQFGHRALAGRIEPPEQVDLIPEEFQAHRQRFSRRPDVQDTAAPGKLAWLEDDIHGLIADIHPGTRQTVRGQGLVDFDRPAGLDKITPRQGARHQSSHGGNNDRRQVGFGCSRQMVNGQRGQRLQAVPPGAASPGGLFVKHWRRLREIQARRVLQPKAQLVQQRESMLGPVGDDNDRFAQVLVKVGGQRQTG